MDDLVVSDDEIAEYRWTLVAINTGLGGTATPPVRAARRRAGSADCNTSVLTRCQIENRQFR